MSNLGKIVGLLVVVFFGLTGCLDTDGKIKGSGATNASTSIDAEDVGPGILPPGVNLPIAQIDGPGSIPANINIANVNQMPAPLDGSTCSANEILEWSGTEWTCIATPSGSGGAAATVPASGVQAGALPVGVTLSNISQLPAPMNGTGCNVNEILEWDGSAWICKDSATAGSVIQVASNPSSGMSAGDVVYNTGDNTTYVYDGTAWVPMGSGSAAASVPASGVLAGTLGSGVLLPTSQLSGTIDPATQIGAGALPATVTISSTSQLPAPMNGTGCSANEILQWSGTAWTCESQVSGADNLGNHTATQNLDLATSLLVGNGGTAGVAIDVNGNVGIGTTAPMSKLDITGAVSDGYAVRLTEGAESYFGGEDFVHLSGDSTAYYTSSEHLGFKAGETLPFGSDPTSYHMFIDKDTGAVGIGTTDPTAPLEVQTGIGGAFSINHAGPGAPGGSYQSIVFRRNGSDLAHIFSGSEVGPPGAGNLQFWTDAAGVGGSEKMRITPTGNVGIGTTAPTSQLHVVNKVLIASNPTVITEVPTAAAFRVQGNADGSFSSYFGSVDGEKQYIQVQNGNGNDLGGGDLLLQPFSGNVGIGTTAPLAKLHVKTGVGTQIQTGSFGYIGEGPAGYPYFGHAAKYDGANWVGLDTFSTGRVIYGTANNDLRFGFVAGGGSTPLLYDIMTIASDGVSTGNVGIGTTTFGPNGLFQVNGSIGVSGNREIRPASNADTDRLKFMGNQLVVGDFQSTAYSYTGGSLLAAFSTLDGFNSLIEVGNPSADARFKISNSSVNNVSLNLSDAGGNSVLYSDTSTGKVGIGTTSPATGGEQDLKLHVAGAVGADFYCDAAGDSCAAASVFLNGLSTIQTGDSSAMFAGSDAKAGEVFYNTSDDKTYVFNGKNWKAMDGSGSIFVASLDDLKGSDVKAGEMVFNSSLGKLQYFNGTEWVTTAEENGLTHKAEKNIDLGGFNLVSNGGKSGLSVNSLGAVSVGEALIPSERFSVSDEFKDQDGIHTVASFNVGSLERKSPKLGLGYTVLDGEVASNTIISSNDLDLDIVVGEGDDAIKALSINNLGEIRTASGAHLSKDGTWMSASDIRLKRDVKNLTKYGLETVLKLESKDYVMRESGKEQIGFIAQEVLELIPEVVSTEGETLGIAYGQMSAVLVNAIKELKAEKDDEISALKTEKENEINELKAENAIIKAEMKELKSLLTTIIKNFY